MLAGKVRWSVETMIRQPTAAAARTFSSNEAWPSENEVWVWQSTSGQADMATPLHLANPLHCNGVAFNTPGTPELEIDWKGCAVRPRLRSQNMYISLQKLQKMTCLEADVHV